ncbi:type VI secretion system contractile sheath small subunit [Salinisphaera sp. Q1T1-3]|uniref:type VI secretion system contractile sheath small subunit n=1 Tax=Salinisphaera sp. Q1T1-3 TaxID=2321229 RepID=UPI000E722041|nr:type VI secretion system contractile sheath small subunit [Salinisphaera sp. Q1T1-3]RJS91698.1 type VI secretion system contractile sheath small subunit [Salinisphaera sp. Q1T1-3]
MAKKESVQKRLQKVRPPRVQLTYEVEKGDAIEQKELPFVVGALGDYRGQSVKEQPRLKDRKFVEVDNDNIDDVMSGLEPRATYRVPNKLSDEGGEFGVDMAFTSMDDFSPDRVVEQVEPLRQLVEARQKLADLRNKIAGNEKLEDLLAEVLSSTEKLDALKKAAPDSGRDDDGDKGDA